MLYRIFLSPMNDLNINFSKMNGLVPCIVQDARTQRTLMLGFMNEEAYNKTLREKRVTFFSRSKQRLWTKGETSGNYLELVNVLLDCDQDTLLVKVNPRGPSCHTGADTCFNEKNITLAGGAISSPRSRAGYDPLDDPTRAADLGVAGRDHSLGSIAGPDEHSLLPGPRTLGERDDGERPGDRQRLGAEFSTEGRQVCSRSTMRRDSRPRNSLRSPACPRAYSASSRRLVIEGGCAGGTARQGLGTGLNRLPLTELEGVVREDGSMLEPMRCLIEHRAGPSSRLRCRRVRNRSGSPWGASHPPARAASGRWLIPIEDDDPDELSMVWIAQPSQPLRTNEGRTIPGSTRSGSCLHFAANSGDLGGDESKSSRYGGGRRAGKTCLGGEIQPFDCRSAGRLIAARCRNARPW